MLIQIVGFVLAGLNASRLAALGGLIFQGSASPSHKFPLIIMHQTYHTMILSGVEVTPGIRYPWGHERAYTTLIGFRVAYRCHS